MTRDLLQIAIRFIFLILFQVTIANQMHLFGFINPQIGVLFVLWFPLSNNKTGILFASFLFGLTIDMFSSSGGINAFSYVLISYIYLGLLKFTVRDYDLDYNLYSLQNYNLPTVGFLVFILAFVHQFALYSLDYFNIQFILSILWKSLVNSIFTTFVILLLLSIFRTRK